MRTLDRRGDQSSSAPAARTTAVLAVWRWLRDLVRRCAVHRNAVASRWRRSPVPRAPVRLTRWGPPWRADEHQLLGALAVTSPAIRAIATEAADRGTVLAASVNGGSRLAGMLARVLEAGWPGWSLAVRNNLGEAHVSARREPSSVLACALRMLQAPARAAGIPG